MSDIRAVSRDIALVTAEVKRFGSGTILVQAMTREIRAEGKPLVVAIKASSVNTLPARGGLGTWVSKAGYRISIRRSGRSAGVSIVGSRRSKGGRSDLKAINRGRVRHPSWGRRGRGQWHNQSVRPGFFDRPVTEHQNKFREAIIRAVETAKQKVGLG